MMVLKKKGTERKILRAELTRIGLSEVWEIGGFVISLISETEKVIIINVFTCINVIM